MKVFIDVVNSPSYSVTKIEFCCAEMAEDILLNRVTTRPWTDHPLGFWVKDKSNNGYRLSHCGHCGSKILGACADDIVATPGKL